MTGLYIIVPVFNGWNYTSRCLAALRASTYRDFHVIVVDHGSTDATKKELPRDFPEALQLFADPRLWWSGATNVGIRFALDRDCQYVMLLNNDCYVAPETIETVMKFAMSSNNAVIAPVQKDLATGRYLAVAPMDNMLLGFPTLPGGNRMTARMRSQGLISSRLITGGRGVVIPRNVFRNVGLLDEEHLPHYYADHDFYFRCRKQGLALLIATTAEVLVDQDQTSIANSRADLSWSGLKETLGSPRSHRNFSYVSALFKKHYPFLRLYGVGIALYYARYFAAYGVVRVLTAFRRLFASR